jgi:hypothetical protein
MSNENPADLLRQAAGKLEELDRGATGGPWKAEGTALDDISVATPEGWEVACVYSIGNAELISTFRPVAVPIAQWLRTRAMVIEVDSAQTGKPVMDLYADNVARAVLGMPARESTS